MGAMSTLLLHIIYRCAIVLNGSWGEAKRHRGVFLFPHKEIGPMKRFLVDPSVAHSQEGHGGVAVSSKQGLTLSEGFLLVKAGVEDQAQHGDKHRHGNTHRHRQERIGPRRH